MPAEKIITTCAIAGGGPAGMMLGLLLARAGVDVVVLEKHADFLRAFRGDTIHPSTLEIRYELGILDAFLKRPHQEVRELAGEIGETRIILADFSHLPTQCRFIALMPQWDFLDFLADQARRYPSFHLRMQARVTDLLVEQNRVTGLYAATPDGPAAPKPAWCSSRSTGATIGNAPMSSRRAVSTCCAARGWRLFAPPWPL